MRRGTVRWIFFAVAVAVLVMATQAVAQDSENWAVGKWKGEGPSPLGGGHVDVREYVFKADGTYEGEVNSARFGLSGSKGTYKVDGNRIVISGMYTRGGRAHEATLTRLEPDKVQYDAVSPIDGKPVTGTLSRVK